MYLSDGLSGKTIFTLSATTVARQVTLECFGDNVRLRVPMRRQADRWSANVRLAAGWFFYRFVVDGKPKWDRDANKCKAKDGRACSVAIIDGSNRQKFSAVNRE